MKKKVLIGAGIAAVAGLVVGFLACSGRSIVRVRDYIDPRGGRVYDDDELASEFLRNQHQR